MEYIELDKKNGIQPVAMKKVRTSVGSEREKWRLAMQAEVDSLRDNQTFEVASAAELRKVEHSDILPMKLVTGTPCDARAGTERKNARAVACGNFQKRLPNADLYSANADVASARAM